MKLFYCNIRREEVGDDDYHTGRMYYKELILKAECVAGVLDLCNSGQTW